MSIESDAAKAHIEALLNEAYIPKTAGHFGVHDHLLKYPKADGAFWVKEYRFAPPRLWRFDYAVPAILCANCGLFLSDIGLSHPTDVIEIDGGTFKACTGHNSPVGLRRWREKHNAAMSLGWRVWHYAPEEIIKAGRKCL